MSLGVLHIVMCGFRAVDTKALSDQQGTFSIWIDGHEGRKDSFAFKTSGTADAGLITISEHGTTLVEVPDTTEMDIRSLEPRQQVVLNIYLLIQGFVLHNVRTLLNVISDNHVITTITSIEAAILWPSGPLPES